MLICICQNYFYNNFLISNKKLMSSVNAQLNTDTHQLNTDTHQHTLINSSHVSQNQQKKTLQWNTIEKQLKQYRDQVLQEILNHNRQESGKSTLQFLNQKIGQFNQKLGTVYANSKHQKKTNQNQNRTWEKTKNVRQQGLKNEQQKLVQPKTQQNEQEIRVQEDKQTRTVQSKVQLIEKKQQNDLQGSNAKVEENVVNAQNDKQEPQNQNEQKSKGQKKKKKKKNR